MEVFLTYVVGLPDQLKAAIAVGILFLVRLALSGRVPDATLTEIAAIVTTAVVAGVELALGLIPAQFDAIVAAILNLIVVLLGAVLVIRAYLVVRAASLARGFRI